MNATTFTYYVLRYTHSQLWEERINVGLLFWFPEQQRWVFRSNLPIPALQRLYPGSLRWLRGCAKAIDDAVKAHLANPLEVARLAGEPDRFVFRQLLPVDGSALQFDEGRVATSLLSEPELIADQYEVLCFGDRIAASIQTRLHDEEHLRRTFRQQLASLNEKALDLLRAQVPLRAALTEVRFDYAWQNGKLNLVKPISFDLKEASAIQHKAVLNYGQFELLGDYAKQHRLQFDLLISQPINPELRGAYRNALQVLQKVKAPKRIIPEDELTDYVVEAASSIKPVEHPELLG